MSQVKDVFLQKWGPPSSLRGVAEQEGLAGGPREAGGWPPRGWGVGAVPAPCSSSSLCPFPPAGHQVSTPAWVIQSQPPAGCDPGPVG